MESAIPPHLQTARTRHRRVPDDYQPPYPAFVARHRPAVERVVMAYFGLQYAGDAPPARAAALAWLETMFAGANGPKHWDRAAYRDDAGYHNVVSVAYWDDQQTFEAWLPAARDGWTGDKQNHAGLGTFIEVVSPSVSGDAILFARAARRRRHARRWFQRRHHGARLLGRHARPHPERANQRPGAVQLTKSNARRRARACKTARQYLSDPFGPGLE